jgi:hypothetical protein
MERKFMNSRNFLRRLNALENQFAETQEMNERGEEIVELLREYEKAVEPLRQNPKSVALELELVQECVRDMVKEGILKNAEPMGLAETGAEGEQGREA